jgi:hypothetical protein
MFAIFTWVEIVIYKIEYKKPGEIYFNKKIPVDYVKNMDNLLVPRKVIRVLNVGPQVQQ